MTIEYETKTATTSFDPKRTIGGAIASASIDASYSAERSDEGRL